MKRLLLALSVALFLCGCGSGSSTTSKSTSTVATVTVTAASSSVASGTTDQFTAVAKDSSGNTISGAAFTWTSTTTTVATISSTGLATGALAGTTQITATSGGVTSSAVTLTVTPGALATVTVTAASSSVASGATDQFTAVGKDSAGNTISGLTFTWASSITAVATISSSGLATGALAGTTQITATSGSITSSAVTLTVTAGSLAKITVSGASSSVASGATDQFTAVGTDGAGNTVSGLAFAWTSGTVTVATISNTGVATGELAGTTQITATSGGVTSNVVTLTVTPGALATITITGPSSSIAAGATEQFTAAGMDLAGNTISGLAFTWTSSTTTTATISSTGMALGVSTGTTSITATSGSITSNAVLLTVNSSASLTITTTSLSPATSAVSGTYSATLGASGGTPPYTWNLYNSTVLPAGLTLTPSASTLTATLAGTPDYTGTATFSVTVTDSAAAPATSAPQIFSITVDPSSCGSGYESRLSGQYAFSLSGFNSTGYLAAVGSFAADGSGNITAGEMDSNGTLYTQAQQASLTTGSSFYSVGSDNRGCATLVTSFGTFTTRFTLGTIPLSGIATQGNVIEWDTLPSATSAFIGTGQILLQTAPTVGVSGAYAFKASGVDSTGFRVGAIGVLSDNGTSATAGEMDLNDAGTTGTYTVETAGTSTTPDTNGRITVNPTWNTLGTSNYVIYLVSGSKGLLMTSGDSATTVVMAGEVDLQSVTPSASSLDGTMVFYLTGMNSGGGASVGLVAADGTSSVGVTDYQDKAGTPQTTPTTFTCTYAVDSYGRMSLSGSAAACTGSGTPVLYISGTNSAFMLGTGGAVDIGNAEPQVGSDFTVAYLSGTYYTGTLEVVNQGQEAEVKYITVAGSGSGSFTTDSTEISTTPGINYTGTGTLTVATDGTISSSGTPIGFIISSTRFVLLDGIGETYPYITVYQQ